MRIVSPLAALSLILTSSLSSAELAAQPAPDLSRLTAEHRAMLGCAAVFAVVASEQAASRDAALAYPPLAWRGREYFVQTSAAIMDQAGLSREAVRTLLTEAAADLQKRAAAAGPDAAVSAAMAPCLPRLDQAVPPLETPDLLQCTAILKVAYEDIHAREGLSPRAQDIATLAAVLSAREKEALQAKGASSDAADRKLAEAHDKLIADAAAPGGAGAEKYDIAHCYELARPDPKSHY